MRIKLYRNGHRADGQKFIVPETWEALLEKASRALSTATEPFAASRLFDDHGFEIKELEVPPSWLPFATTGHGGGNAESEEGHLETNRRLS